MIQETERQIGEDKYGGTWDYIPVNKIEALSLGEKDDGLLVLSIYLPQNDRLEFLFEASLRSEVDQLLERFRKLSIA